MNLNNTGGMYGREGAFWNNLPQGFSNYVWIELIGFDREKQDCGVGDFIDKTGFTPSGVFLLVTSVDIINTHRDLQTE